MTIATLLVHLDDDARADGRLAQSIELAKRFSSCLVGLSCRPPAPWREEIAQPMLGPDLLIRDLAQARQAALEREAAFLRACDQAALGSFEVIGEDDGAADALLRHGRCSDLVVLGQPDPADPDHSNHPSVVHQVVLESSRPTLLLPCAGRLDSLGDNVLVAWDDSREAARAVADALPLLRQASRVHLVQFDPSAGDSGTIDQARNDRVLRWLARHGVKAKASVAWSTADIGNALLSQAADVGADLLVMGAWGKSRLVERLLGGATHTVLESMTLPVLVSH